MPRLVMAIDASKCLNCKACIIACQQQNNVAVGDFRNWVKVNDNENSPTGYSYQPGNCMQCDDPLCVQACPTHATYKAEDGVVLIDKRLCIACGSCVQACPYNARHINKSSKVADKCDYCAEARAEGLEPACVRICTTRNRTFGDANDPNSKVSQILAQTKENRGHSYVQATNTPTKPSLTYIGEVYPSDWPKDVTISQPIALMGVMATGIRWLGGLSLFGVIAVFIKQIFLPSEEKETAHNKDKSIETSTTQDTDKKE